MIGHKALMFTRGEFNDASALGRSLYWCQALHITYKDRYQSTSARRALALLNSPLNTCMENYDMLLLRLVAGNPEYVACE